MTCEHCGAEVPDGDWCTRCGAHRAAGDAPAARLRWHRFAAGGGHVAIPEPTAALLPHAHRHGVYRGIAAAGLIVVIVLGLLGAIGAAIVLAAVLVPGIMVVSLRQADFYRSDPIPTLLLSVGAGAAVGVGLTIAINRLGNNFADGAPLLFVILAALVQEALKPVLPLMLRGRYPDTIDGLTFGAAAGAGYAVAQSLVNLGQSVGDAGLHGTTDNWVYTLVSVAILIPLLQAGCSALVCGAGWRLLGRGAGAGITELLGLPLALLAHAAFDGGSVEIAGSSSGSPLLVIGWQLLVVAMVIFALRVDVHLALLDEARELGVRSQRCPRCGETVEAASFCPRCGAAMTAGRQSDRATPAAV